MAITLINLSGFQRGILSNEVGINCSKFSVVIEPEVNEWLLGITGQARGKAVGDPMSTLSIEGEISGATGVMAATFVTAFIPVNVTSYFGRSAGGYYMDKATVDQERTGWLNVNAEYSSKFNVA